MARQPKPPKLKIMVSSSVRGNEEILDRVYAMLDSFGYQVLMSRKGSIPVRPGNHPFKDCLAAVAQCDIFLGLITPSYGSGMLQRGGLSITHRELRLAIRLGKPRWMLAHYDVDLARRLLMDLGYEGAKGRAGLALQKKSIIDNLKIIDMYEIATRRNLPVNRRAGSWVQSYRTLDEVAHYISVQFSDSTQVRARL